MDNAVKLADAKTEAAAGLIAGRDAAEEVAKYQGAVLRVEDDGRPYRIKKDGEIELLEGLLASPIFRRGQTSFYDAASFSAFVNRFKNQTSLVFADALGAKFTGVLDYHPEGEDRLRAGWDQFRAEFPLRFTPSWKRWIEANKQPMTQADFAQFLEDQIPDIHTPAGAVIVELARTLEAKNSVSFESHVRADNGAHVFGYAENIQATAGQGKVQIPSEFVLVLQPFEGSDKYTIQARFRYRITSKQLLMWFDLVRVEDVLKQAFTDEEAKIREAIGETPVLHGPAPAAQIPAKS